MNIKFFDEIPFMDISIQELFQATYPEREFNLDYWKWRFSNGNSEIAYIEDNRKIISFYAVSEVKFVCENKTFSCGLMNSAMTHPEYGGKGLFAKLEVALHSRLLNEKGFKFLYGFANHNAHRIHRKHADWKDVFVLNNFYVDSDRLLSKANLANRFTYHFIRAKEYNFKKIADFFVSESNYQFARTTDYLNWRIKDPRNDYQVLEIKIEDKLVALLLFKEFQSSIDIMEVFYFSKEFKFEALKGGLLYLAKGKRGFYIWSNLHSEEHVFLESSGFQEKDFNTYFGYISNGFVLDREKVHYRFLDSDVY